MGNTEKTAEDAFVLIEDEIMGILPHRNPMLMVVEAEIQRDQEGKLIQAEGYPNDAIRELPFRDEMADLKITSNLATATIKVLASDPGFSGHFPEPIGPIYPGVQQLRLLRKLAQMITPDRRLYLSGIKDVKFSALVFPGSELTLSAEQEENGWIHVKAIARGGVTCEGSIRFLEVEHEGHLQSVEILIESIAQLTAVVELSLPENAGKKPLFASIKHMEISREIYIGEWPVVKVHSIKTRGPVGFAQVSAYVTIAGKPETVMIGTIGFATGN